VTIEGARSAKLAPLMDPDAQVELLGGGFKFTEGPIWHPSERCLLFSDIAGDARHRWTSERGFELARRPNGMGNGMTLDRDSNLLVCEHATSSVVRERPDGTRTTLVVDWFEVWSKAYWRRYLGGPRGWVGWAVQRRCVAGHRSSGGTELNLLPAFVRSGSVRSKPKRPTKRPTGLDAQKLNY